MTSRTRGAQTRSTINSCLSATRDWLAELVEAGQAGRHLPLLRTVDQWRNLGPISPKGWGLTRQAVNVLVKQIAAKAELDIASDVTAHGLRAGVPTDLGANGHGDGGEDPQGRRRAGKRTDDGTRARALSMLRVQRPTRRTVTDPWDGVPLADAAQASFRTGGGSAVPWGRPIGCRCWPHEPAFSLAPAPDRAGASCRNGRPTVEDGHAAVVGAGALVVCGVGVGAVVAQGGSAVSGSAGAAAPG